MAKFRCCLVNVVDPGHVIKLPSNQKTFIGRSEETKIDDPFCSRKQVCLKANTDEGYLLIKPCGSNPLVGLNGFRLDGNDEAYEALDGDILELILDKYKFRVSFIKEENEEKENLIDDDVEMETSDDLDRKEIKNGQSFNLEEAKETTWERISNGELYVLTWKGVKPSSKIAAYDIDGTIIKTQSGRVFPKDINDWQLAYPEVPGKLKSYFKDGYKIVFFTNQSSIGKNKMKPEEFKSKLEKIISKINIPIQAFVATGTNFYRKPMTGMWKHLQEHANGNVPIDMVRSFYVGDAAGRPAKPNSKIKKDHSCCDRLFALNLNLPFLTPEEHLHKAKESIWIRPEFDPSNFSTPSCILEPKDASLQSKNQEIIVIVGFPGSGKSFFSKSHSKNSGYVVINRDTLGSWQKCVQEAETAIESKKSVIIDNTNPDVESRKRYIELARKRQIPIRCFVMTTSYKQCKHNIRFRELLNPQHPKINEMVLNSYKSKFTEPDTREGFAEIVRVNFNPEFKEPDHEKLYRSFLLES